MDTVYVEDTIVLGLFKNKIFFDPQPLFVVIWYYENCQYPPKMTNVWSKKFHLWVKISKKKFSQNFLLAKNNPVEKILEGVFWENFDIFEFLTSEVNFEPFLICGQIKILVLKYVSVWLEN